MPPSAHRVGKVHFDHQEVHIVLVRVPTLVCRPLDLQAHFGLDLGLAVEPADSNRLATTLGSRMSNYDWSI